MRLYSMHRNSAGWRVRIALHFKAIPFEYISISALPPGAYSRINPQGLMPALEVDSAVIAQSAAILELIEECHPTPPLLPTDPLERAKVRAFTQLIACDLHPLNNNRVRRYLVDPMGHSESEILSWYRHWVALGLTSLEDTLQRCARIGPFCFGEEPTLADVHLVPQMYNCRRFGCDLYQPALIMTDGPIRGVRWT